MFQDLLALLARSHFVVCTDDGVLTRLASEKRVSVDFVPWPNKEEPDLFNAECKEKFLYFLKIFFSFKQRILHKSLLRKMLHFSA